MEEKDITIIERIKGLEVTINNGIKADLADIKRQIYNHLPTQMEGIKNCLHKTKLSNSKWLISILVSLVFLLGAAILNLVR